MCAFLKVFCADRQQHSGADSRGDGDGEDDSPGEPGGAGPLLHLQHHPHTVLLGDLQGESRLPAYLPFSISVSFCASAPPHLHRSLSPALSLSCALSLLCSLSVWLSVCNTHLSSVLISVSPRKWTAVSVLPMHYLPLSFCSWWKYVFFPYESFELLLVIA